ncbi:MAG TPA: hypothetical protein VGV92_01000 [Gammaproteobacteria bacterium]|nr:hypothetical protein [Gammaproteobacteria bacterium]
MDSFKTEFKTEFVQQPTATEISAKLELYFNRLKLAENHPNRVNLGRLLPKLFAQKNALSFSIVADQIVSAIRSFKPAEVQLLREILSVLGNANIPAEFFKVNVFRILNTHIDDEKVLGSFSERLLPEKDAKELYEKTKENIGFVCDGNEKLYGALEEAYAVCVKESLIDAIEKYCVGNKETLDRSLWSALKGLEVKLRESGAGTEVYCNMLALVSDIEQSIEKNTAANKTSKKQMPVAGHPGKITKFAKECLGVICRADKHEKFKADVFKALQAYKKDAHRSVQDEVETVQSLLWFTYDSFTKEGNTLKLIGKLNRTLSSQNSLGFDQRLFIKIQELAELTKEKEAEKVLPPAPAPQPSVVVLQEVAASAVAEPAAVAPVVELSPSPSSEVLAPSDSLGDTGSSGTTSPPTNQFVLDDDGDEDSSEHPEDADMQESEGEEAEEKRSPVLERLIGVLDNLIRLIQERIEVLTRESELQSGNKIESELEAETLYADLDDVLGLRDDDRLLCMEDDELEKVERKIEDKTREYVKDLETKRESSSSEKDGSSSTEEVSSVNTSPTVSSKPSSTSGDDSVLPVIDPQVVTSPSPRRYSPTIFVAVDSFQEETQQKQEVKLRLEKILNQELVWVESQIQENQAEFLRVKEEKDELLMNPVKELRVDPFLLKVRLLKLLNEKGFAELAEYVESGADATLDNVLARANNLGEQGKELKPAIRKYFRMLEKLKAKSEEKSKKLEALKKVGGLLNVQKENIQLTLNKVEGKEMSLDALLVLEKEKAPLALEKEKAANAKLAEAQALLSQTLSAIDLKIQEKLAEAKKVREEQQQLDIQFSQKKTSRFTKIREKLQEERRLIFMHKHFPKKAGSANDYSPALIAVETDLEKTREEKIKDLVTTGWFTRFLFNISSRYKKDLRTQIGKQLDDAKTVNDLEAYLSKKDSSFDHAPREARRFVDSFWPQIPLFEVFLSSHFQEKKKYDQKANESDRKLQEIQGELHQLEYERSRAPAKISLMYSQLVEVSSEQVERTTASPRK